MTTAIIFCTGCDAKVSFRNSTSLDPRRELAKRAVKRMCRCGRGKCHIMVIGE